jgi:hypothetical protein
MTDSGSTVCLKARACTTYCSGRSRQRAGRSARSTSQDGSHRCRTVAAVIDGVSARRAEGVEHGARCQASPKKMTAGCTVSGVG